MTAPLTWAREDGGYWSDDGCYYICKTVASEGPWVLRHDPAGESPGWGTVIAVYLQTLREVKQAAELHREGTDWPNEDGSLPGIRGWARSR